MAYSYMYVYTITNTLPGHFENKEELPILQIQVSWPLQFVYSNQPPPPICLFKSRLLRLCEAAGMRTTWVLTEEERKQKFEGRTKRKSCSDNNEELSEEELVAIGGYVKASDYWDQSNDLDTSLLRQIIRMVAFGARITIEGQVTNKVLTM